jgi:hypothetical protein
MVAVLAASLLIAAGFLILRRNAGLKPQSAWLFALEVPG